MDKEIPMQGNKLTEPEMGNEKHYKYIIAFLFPSTSLKDIKLYNVIIVNNVLTVGLVIYRDVYCFPVFFSYFLSGFSRVYYIHYNINISFRFILT